MSTSRSSGGQFCSLSSRDGGTNYGCTTTTSPGCWGHRENILATTNSGYSEIMGVASVNTNFAASTGTYMEKDAAIFVPIATSDLSQMTYLCTWSQAVADGAQSRYWFPYLCIGRHLRRFNRG